MSSLTERVLALGARRAALVPVAEVPFDRSFRTLCEQNSCGKYGRCYMCPPDIGEIDALISRAKELQWVLVYQTVGELEDSFDIENMLEAGRCHNELAQRITAELQAEPFTDRLHLVAGGCKVCDRCAKMENAPCRFPQRALSSVEAFGVDVSGLAGRSGLPYINGTNTVTYFGAYFHST